MKILLVTYHFPPGTAAGATRPYGLALEWSRMGHEVVVVTAQPQAAHDGFKVISVPDRGVLGRARTAAMGSGSESVATRVAGSRAWLRRLTERTVRSSKSVLMHPDERRRWSRDVVREVVSACEPPFDWVVATAPPFSAFYAGRALARRLGARLALEYRDLWTESAYYPYGTTRRALDRRRESKLLGTADAIVTATTLAGREMRVAFPHAVQPRAVYTGIDTAAWRAPVDEKPGDPIVLSHFGSLYEGRRDLDLLARALGGLGTELSHSDVGLRVRLYGRRDGHAEESFKDAGVAEYLEFVGSVPREEVPRRLGEADAALLVVWDNPADACSLPSKAVEYLASGRRVIAIGARAGSEVYQLLGAFEGVDLCLSTEDVTEAVRGVLHRRVAGERSTYDRAAELGPYEREHMARAYLDVLGGGRV